MTTGADDSGADPRTARSRRRLLDAAATLLESGGPEAVTIEAVTRLSKVARTTLYRHFASARQLRAATLERLLPPVIETAPPGGLRDGLVTSLVRQAAIIDEAPLHMSGLAWLATADRDSGADGATDSLRTRLIEQYRAPFDRVLETPEARARLGDFDRTRALAQLLGPIVFAKLVGLETTTPEDCARLVDDFLIARDAERERERRSSAS
ncbi:TetR/AcrR family transcriptional regulator [Nocardia higoensis]|uniref:TetR/AcrR family transcriptional regulator n=1 Tax=Nocardia higoensis TaxID=228599 RepID=A0ABS0D889_9NOCA|nr:TetR/AcrR family transcriptional regulator [Nocardia higoensis]MBF6354320.1 TetR/AcrR family transcriptional regulator [Nocardia higoensis]